MRSLPAMQHKLPRQGLHHVLNLLKPAAERAARKVHPVRGHFPDRALERFAQTRTSLTSTSTQKSTAKSPLAISLAGLGAVRMPRPLRALATGTITVAHMPAADQTHLPADLLAFFLE